MTQSQTHSLQGQVCLITGANSGIGFITASRLAERGAEVWMLCRSPERGAQAQAEIAALSASSGAPSPRLFLADLSDLEQVRRVASEVRDANRPIDVLVNNAGLIVPTRQESAQGNEYTLAANHLGAFTLTHHLTPQLEAAPRGRIVNVASEAHRAARLDWDDLQWSQRRYSSFAVYGTSKLFNILFTQALARRLKDRGSQITTNSLHPGVIRTGFGKDYQGAFKLLVSLSAPFLSSPERGARTSIYLASSPEVAAVSGEYFIRCKPARPRKLGRSVENAERLWELSESLCAPYLSPLE